MTEPLFISEPTPGRMVVVTLTELRDRYRWACNAASVRALWCRDYPGAEPNTCRYCGKHWRQWFGSKLDGHSKCIVDEEFKAWLRELLRDPKLTYEKIAKAIDVTPSVVRSWTFPIRGGK